jgi:hypothetical protein
MAFHAGFVSKKQQRVKNQWILKFLPRFPPASKPETVRA